MLSKKKTTIELDSDDFGALAVCALRYCQGRRTYMPHLITAIVSQHLAKVLESDLIIMIRECENQAERGNYGNEAIDKPIWDRFYSALKSEAERRKLR